MKIRLARIGDMERLTSLIFELAEFEKLAHECFATADQLRASVFDGEKQREYLRVYIAELDQKVVGYAICFFNFSTFLAKKGMYLEDLYITPESRGKGYGQKFLKFLAKEAVDLDCGRLEWAVLNWNKKAIDLYEFLGAKPQSEWTTYRLQGDQLKLLAQGASN